MAWIVNLKLVSAILQASASRLSQCYSSARGRYTDKPFSSRGTTRYELNLARLRTHTHHWQAVNLAVDMSCGSVQRTASVGRATEGGHARRTRTVLKSPVRALRARPTHARCDRCVAQGGLHYRMQAGCSAQEFSAAAPHASPS